MAFWVARLECAVCQGTLSERQWCSLNCGHCYHTQCINAWLERSSTCPSCRASAKKRHIRPLNGIEAVQDAADASQPLQQAGDQQQVINQLQQQLDAAEQQGQELAALVQQLESVQDGLRDKLKTCRHRCSELEEQRLQDAERLMTVNAELSRLKESYYNKNEAVERLKQALQEEQSRRAEADQKRKRADADLRHLQLQNPALSVHAMQRLIDAQGQDLQSLDPTQLLLTLGRRNEQLKRAEACTTQLQQHLQQQEAEADAQLTAARSRQQAAEARAAKQQDECMKQVINLEYKVDTLEQERAQLSQQLQDLQSVLLALERGTGAAQRQQQQQANLQASGRSAAQQPSGSSGRHPSSLPQAVGGSSPGSSEKENDPAAAFLDDWDLGSDAELQEAGPVLPTQGEWHADVAAAVGPGSLLRRPAHIAQAPSFLKSGVAGAACGVKVQGQLLRQGPDGKGSTARHLPSFVGKRGLAGNKDALTKGPSTKKARGAACASSNILNFFGKKN